MLSNMEEALAYNHECAKALRGRALFGLMEDASSVQKLKLRESSRLKRNKTALGKASGILYLRAPT